MSVGRTRVVAFHKPLGLVTTHADELGRETVYARLNTMLTPELRAESWHAIGRLDLDTTGLLLFTNDGALVHHATQPATKLAKTYRVLAKGLLTPSQLEALQDGVELSAGLGQSGPAEAWIEDLRIATTDLGIRITEGKNRQVRRMLLAVGSQVIRLQRVEFGAIKLDVPEGAWRLLSDDEVARDLGYLPRPLPGATSQRPRRAARDRR